MKCKVVFDINESIFGLHIPWVETNSFNERKLVNDLLTGRLDIAIASHENDHFNTNFDRWLLKLKHEFKMRWLANLIAHTVHRFIIIPALVRRLKKIRPDYFLVYERNGKYSGEVETLIGEFTQNEFTLVIFTTRDKWDSKVYCLPTNLIYQIDSEGKLTGKNKDGLFFPPTSLKTQDLIFGKPWGKISGYTLK